MAMPMPHTNSHRVTTMAPPAPEVTVHQTPDPLSAAAAAAALAAAVIACRLRHERAPGGYDSQAHADELQEIVAEAGRGFEEGVA